MVRKLVTMAGVILAALWAATGAAAQRPTGATGAAGKAGAAQVPPRFVTKAGYAACISRPKLDTLTMYVAEHDSIAYRKLLSKPKSGCFRLKAGVDVVPVATDNLVVQIRPVGARRTVFTVVEALGTVPTQESVVRKK